MKPLSRSFEVHSAAVVVDGHCDTILKLCRDGGHLWERKETGHLDLPRLRQGGVDIQVFACYIEPQYKPDRGLQAALQLIDFYWQEVEACRELRPILSVSDLEAVATSAAGQVGALLALEGGEAMGDHLAYLRMLYRLGVRLVTLTWNQRNLIADGVGEERTRGGLSRFGVEVVREMNRLGIVVDVSHIAPPGFWDVAEVSRAPFVASHSCCRALCEHSRNLTDDQIRALARSGGVVGINFAREFLVPSGEATLDDVLNHIEHVVSLVGPDHVGLGSDFDGIATTPRGLDDVTRLPAITEGLLGRGYSEEDIHKILGGNFLRVLRQVMGT